MGDAAQPGLSADARALMLFEAKKKSLGLSYVFWFFLGGFGAHRFYNGRPGSAVAMLLLWLFGWLTIVVGIGFVLLGAVGIWLLIDAFLIPGMVSAHNAELLGQLDRQATAAAAA